MLQDTDFFDKLARWSSIGDVHAKVEWEESPSPDERYTVKLEWRFRKKIIGNAHIVIQPVLDTDKFSVLWINIAFVAEWQNKSMYSELVKSYMDEFPQYGIKTFVGPPLDNISEAIYKATGFEWADQAFVLDLEGERIKEWRAYKDGKVEQPQWRHDALAEAGLLDASETI